MTLETLTPTPTWDETAHRETVEVFASLGDEITIRVWGADWCKDCRAILPDFAAAMDAAGIPVSSIEQYAVDNNKEGELTDEYGIEYIPTIVIERDGEEIARFVEEEPVSAATYLAERLRPIVAEQ